MLTLLRMPDEVYRHELDQVCLPQWALPMMHAAFADPHSGFYYHALNFMHYNYNADGHQMEHAFQLLQQDLVRGRVLITRRLMDAPAFAWIPASEDVRIPVPFDQPVQHELITGTAKLHSSNMTIIYLWVVSKKLEGVS